MRTVRVRYTHTAPRLSVLGSELAHADDQLYTYTEVIAGLDEVEDYEDDEEDY